MSNQGSSMSNNWSMGNSFRISSSSIIADLRYKTIIVISNGVVEAVGRDLSKIRGTIGRGMSNSNWVSNKVLRGSRGCSQNCGETEESLHVYCCWYV